MGFPPSLKCHVLRNDQKVGRLKIHGIGQSTLSCCASSRSRSPTRYSSDLSGGGPLFLIWRTRTSYKLAHMPSQRQKFSILWIERQKHRWWPGSFFCEPNCAKTCIPSLGYRKRAWTNTQSNMSMYGGDHRGKENQHKNKTANQTPKQTKKFKQNKTNTKGHRHEHMSSSQIKQLVCR